MDTTGQNRNTPADRMEAGWVITLGVEARIPLLQFFDLLAGYPDPVILNLDGRDAVLVNTATNDDRTVLVLRPFPDTGESDVAEEILVSAITRILIY